MNCQSFKNIAAELAREQLPDGAQREKGLQHAASCAACAAQLIDEQMLTTLLRAEHATSLQISGASHRLEGNLQNAFRLHAAQTRQTGLLKTPARVFSREIFYRHSTMLAVAAFVLVAFALFTARVLLPGAKSSDVTVDSNINRAAVPLGSDEEQANKASINVEKQPGNSTARTARRGRSHKTHSFTSQSSTPVVKTYETSVNGRKTSAGDELSEDSSSGREVATDFFALGESAQQTPLESGQVVRVKVPRSALEAFGLPVNMDRENESVKADILLGSDGLARAIRFVR